MYSSDVTANRRIATSNTYNVSCIGPPSVINLQEPPILLTRYSGATGAPGPPGPPGPPGVAGQNGPIGPTGPYGSTGPIGPTGQQGYKGMKGDKGDKGDKGNDGRDGLHGKDGAQGPAGRDGRDGICCSGGGSGSSGTNITWGILSGDLANPTYTNINTVLFDASSNFTITKPTNTSLLISTTSRNIETSYLIDAPPPIVFGQVITSTNYVYIPWTYPSQINVGFINIYLPAINTLSCTWSGNVNGTIMSNQSILIDASGSSVIKYQNLIPNTIYITGIVLTNLNVNNTGYQQMQFPQDVSGTLRYTYVYYTEHFANLARNATENSFTAWYSNYNLNNNKSSVLFDGSLTPIIAVPSAPGRPIFGIQYNITSPISFDISWNTPTVSNASNPQDTNTVIQQYKYTYDTSGSTTRYGGPIIDASYHFATSNSATVINLYPDCSYNFKVSAKNNISDVYGNDSIKSVIYTKYMNPISFENISFPSPTGVSTYSAKLVGNNNSGDVSGARVNNILFSAPTQTWTSLPIISPIHSIENRGSTNNNLLKIRGNIIRGTTDLGSSELSYGGFPATKPDNVISSNFTITSSLPVDTYQNKLPAYRGFYLQVNTFIALHNNLFSDSNNKTIISVEQYQNIDSKPISNYSFYYESMSNAPNISSFDISLNTTNLFQVSGIWVLYGTSKLNATTVISNIGKSFYNKNKILSYHSINKEIGSETDLTNITQYSRTDIELNPEVTIMNIGEIDFSNNLFSKEISLTSVAYNPLDLSDTSEPSSILTIYDQPSYNLITNPTLYPTSIQTVGNGTISNLSDVTGFRVWSDNTSGNIPANVTSLPSEIRYVDISYNHSWDLTSQDNYGYDATQELQIFNGAYGSKGSGSERNGYLDYTNYNKSSSEQNTLNYSSITNSNTDYRFATFCWKCNENAGNYTKITFVMKGITQTIDNPNRKPSVSGKPIHIHYRIEDNDNPHIFTASYKNTLWIDANSSTNGITTGNFYDLSFSNYVSGLLLGGNNTDINYTNTFMNGELRINVLIPSLRNITNNDNIYIYLRIGLPMSVDINFTHVTCSLYARI